MPHRGSRGRSRGRVQGVRPPEMTCGFLMQLVLCKKKKMWFIGVEVEQETSAPPPKKNPGSAPWGGMEKIIIPYIFPCRACVELHVHLTLAFPPLKNMLLF